MRDYQLVLGLLVAMAGSVFVAFAGYRVGVTVERSAFERLYGHAYPMSADPTATAEVTIRRPWAWWIGWALVVIGYAVQGLSAVNVRMF